MQQEQQHGEQRQKSAAKHAVRQQPNEKAADQKEEMVQQMARQVNRARVFKPQNALDRRHRHGERDAVIAVVSPQQMRIRRIFAPKNVIESAAPDSLMRPLIYRHPIIVKDGDADDEEYRERDRRGVARQKV